MSVKKTRLMLLMVLMFAAGAENSVADIVIIPDDYPTYGDAINHISEYDTVMFRPGVYYESYLWYPGDVTFMGEFGSDSTTLDGGGEDMVFSLAHRTPYHYTVTGLTITNAIYGVNLQGRNEVDMNDIKIIGCSTAVGWSGQVIADSCHFVDNIRAVYHAWDGYYKNYEFNNCRFSGTSDKVLNAANSIILDNCTIENNSGSVAEIYTLSELMNAALILNECNINDNGYGISVSGPNCTLGLVDNLYYGNGGGISYSCDTEAYLFVFRNTFAGNAGTGLWFNFDDIPEQIIIINTNIIYGNEIGIESANPLAGEYIACCDVYGNTIANYSGFPDQTGQNDNISIHPLFCEPDNGDYYLSQSSPCLAENSPCGEQIGVFGLGCDEAGICGDIDGNGIVNILDIAYLVAYLYLGGPPPVIPFYADVNGDQSIDMLDATCLISYLYMDGPDPDCS